MIKYILLLTTLPLLIGCLPDANSIPKTKEEIKVVSGSIGKELFFIPSNYILSSINDNRVDLEIQLPSFAPLTKTTAQMWKDGENTKYLRVSILKGKTKISFADYVKSRKTLFRATYEAGNEYGLKHTTQPEGENKDLHDVWVENGQTSSVIDCMDKLDNLDVPQCEQMWIYNNLYIFANYDKKNLSQWKEIQNGVMEVVKSFASSETAKQAVFEKYQEYQFQNGND